ncbi:MAG: fibronectin type III domain-containing protein, partial [Proteobacteria bacterium]|nr:fibronectin type III domain-containing protein [Pseudomonadota bacterium]
WIVRSPNLEDFFICLNYTIAPTPNFELGIVDFEPFAASKNTAAPIAPPSYPSLTTGSNSLTLSWSANSESDLVGYKIYWDANSGYPYQNVIDVGNTTSHTITGLNPDSQYFVTVTAYDSSYNSENDNATTIVNENQTDGHESWYATEQTGTTGDSGVEDTSPPNLYLLRSQ